MALVLAWTAVGCAAPDDGRQAQHLSDDGVAARLFEELSSAFATQAAKSTPIAPADGFEPSGQTDDPAVDELFDVMGLEEVDPGESPSFDGALVGHYQHFPDPNDPNDYYDDVCFFARSPDQMPSQETLFWAEMYGFRPSSGEVSDIHGSPIEQECVFCEEGNVGGGETRVIFYVNGIKTQTETHCATLQGIADLTGAVTIGVMNETKSWVKDIWQTSWDRFTVQIENKLASWGVDKTIDIHENQSAALLTNVIVQRIRSGKHVEIWAHSQGGAVTSLALHRALRALEQEGLYPVLRDGEPYPEIIRVVTFGSAASQWPEGFWPEGPVYTHYVHLRDATPSALGVGAFGGFLTVGKKRAGGDAEMVFFDGEPPAPGEAPSYVAVDEEQAEVGFGELEAQAYHDVLSTYLPMYTQQHGRWEPGK